MVDVIEQGGLASAKSVRERFAARQEELDALDRLVAHKRREIDQALGEIAPERTARFAQALRSRLRDQTNPAFRRAYMRTMLATVEVGPDEIRISGPKAVLSQQLATQTPPPPSAVRTFVQDWRTRQDSNL
ncbi:MAG: hypothetical protein NW206_01630 [Hyphomonadaceae bacterium]|nr:hypothetical protein [Hyphomonadaceae bacterium]